MAVMFFSPVDPPTFRRSLLARATFDFSLPSLKAVDRYLLRVRNDPRVEADWSRTVLRAGAYVGEVIRRALPSGTYRWVDFKTALTVDTSIATFGYSAATAALLYRPPLEFVFPLGKVAKCLEHGAEDNTHFFADCIIARAVSGEPMTKPRGSA